ncbi:MAG: extracellular solute-binding protein [Candidatus Moranbacteria bacterium]|nr:extracellular solute-binding protein [Candidatus Moranbacteria bacterium]
MQKYKKTIVFIGLTLISGIFLSGCGCKKAPAPSVDKITIWGLWDESEVYDKIISAYKDQHRNVKQINYRKLACNESECYDYIREVVQALAAGAGPDIFMINNTWVPAQKDKMLPLDSVNDELVKQKKPKIMTLRDYQEAFVPIAKKDLVYKDSDGVEKIYAVPLWNDNLAVYYNRDLFNLAGLAPPPKNWTWQQFEKYITNFESYVSRITNIDEFGGIKIAGAAIGYGKNVDRSPDILSALMLQMGTPIVNDNLEPVFDSRITSSDNTSFSPGEYALAFFTKFSDRGQKSYTWNKEQWLSVDSFISGRVGMMINYSHRISTIQSKAPNLNFGIASLPQISENIKKPVNFGSYWAFAVSKQATGQKAIECWDFLKFLTAKDQAEQYSQTTGRVSARLDVIDKQKEDPWLGVFADQALYSTSFPQANNARTGKIFEDAIDSIVDQRISPAEASSIASQQMVQEGYLLMKKLKEEQY